MGRALAASRSRRPSSGSRSVFTSASRTAPTSGAPRSTSVIRRLRRTPSCRRCSIERGRPDNPRGAHALPQDPAPFQPLFALFGRTTVLTEEQRAFIASLFVPRAFDKGQFFQRAGEVTTRGAFVSRGCFRTYVIDEAGTEGILQFSPEGAWIG